MGIARDDTKVEAAYLVDKITNLRIFDDDEGKMNLSVKDIKGGLLIVSQWRRFGEAVPLVARGPQMAVTEPAPYSIHPVLGVSTAIPEEAVYLRNRRVKRPTSWRSSGRPKRNVTAK